MSNFLSNFEKTYIRESFNEIDECYNDLRFILSSWNNYESTKSGNPRTTNIVEGWHSKLNKNMGVSHPKMSRFLNVILQEQQGLQEDIELVNNGLEVPKRYVSKKVINKSNTIINNVNMYELKKERGELISYLNSIAFQIDLSEL